jgi:hypothetical protein
MKTLTESGVRWLWSCRRIVFTALLLLATVLVACDEGSMTSRPEIRLTVDKSSVLSGDKVTLTAEVIKGPVTSVTFKRDKGEPITPITTPDEQGNFVAEVAVTEKTVFTAQAKGAGGTAAQSKAVTVDITAPPQAVAVDQTFITYREIPLFYGVTPTDFAATSEVKVEGIVGSVQAEADKETPKGGKVTIEAGENTLAFSYTPPTNRFTGLDTFEYVVKSGEETELGTITVDVKGLDPKISVVSSLSDIAGLPEAQTIVLKKQIFCNQDPCVRLRNNQTLTGTVTTTDGVTLNSPGAGILANIPGTRQPGTPGGSGTESRVIELADDSSVKDLEITGDGLRYFVAIRGTTYDGSGVLEGNINIENVTIKNSNGKPIYFKCQDFPCNQSVNYGEYTLTIDKLRVESAFDTLVFGVPGKLTFKDSFIDLRQPSVNSQSFGDNVGIDVEELLGASIEFNNVDVYMESPKNKLDNNAINWNATPFVITNRRTGSTTNLTVANCDITFGDPDSNWSLATVKTFKLSASSGAAINISANSVTNTSEATGNDVERIGTISGRLGGLE